MSVGVLPTPRQQFLEAYEREHEITMRLLRAYPTDKLDLRPHPKCKTARELAWMFAAERALGTAVLNDWYATNKPGTGQLPQAPADWNDLLTAIETSHGEYRKVVESLSDPQLYESVKFFTGPRKLGDYQRIQFMWFLLSDQIHHRGQFSVYSRMADGKVPSIYGPSADEPWN